jgi:RNA polymerase sigma factor (sigma-70 family)
VAYHGVTPTDSQLLAAAGHDPTAFRQLYDRYAQALDGFFVRRTGDRDAALDLTAETFAQAWAHRHDFDNQHAGSCGPWLFGIARNLLLRSARDRRLASEASERLLMRAGRSTVTPGPEWVEGLDADIADALNQLPPNQRRAIQMRILDDRSYADVANELDCTPLAARIRVSRGLATLRTQVAAGRELP